MIHVGTGSQHLMESGSMQTLVVMWSERIYSFWHELLCKIFADTLRNPKDISKLSLLELEAKSAVCTDIT